MDNLKEEIKQLTDEIAQLDQTISMTIESMIGIAEDIGRAKQEIEFLNEQIS